MGARVCRRSRRRPGQALDLVQFITARGEHEDRPLVLAAHPAADAQAVLAGEHQVEDHQVGLAVDDAPRGTGAIGLHRDLETIGLQVFGGEFGEALVVFDDEDAGYGVVHGFGLVVLGIVSGQLRV